MRDLKTGRGACIVRVSSEVPQVALQENNLAGGCVRETEKPGEMWSQNKGPSTLKKRVTDSLLESSGGMWTG